MAKCERCDKAAGLMSELCPECLTDFVGESLNELQSSFGVRKPIQMAPLGRLHAAGDHQGLANAIALQMGLPVDVRVRVESATTTFDSRHLVCTDETGRGLHGIAAQVEIPSSLPPVGSRALHGYTIDIVLSQGFASATPETAVTLLAHELSHVVLYARRHPKRDSEHVTNLVSLVLGFGEIVKRGRRISTQVRDVNVIRTTTTTYGYLSDSDFSFALKKVNACCQMLDECTAWLLDRSVTIRRNAERNRTLLASIADRITSLDTARQVRLADAARIVAMHQLDYTDDIDATIRQALDVAARAEQGARAAGQYSREVLEELDRHGQECMATLSQLDNGLKQLTMDAATLERNCGVRYRLWELGDRMLRLAIRRDPLGRP